MGGSQSSTCMGASAGNRTMDIPAVDEKYDMSVRDAMVEAAAPSSGVIDDGISMKIRDGTSGLSLEVNQATEAFNGEGIPWLITAKHPDLESGRRCGVDVCCVIDVSWSMSMEAMAAGGERTGYSMLDIAKHAVRTIVHTLVPEDRLAIVSFCQKAEVVLEPTYMDKEGVNKAEAKIDNTITFGNGTMLWKGLDAGLDLFRKFSRSQDGQYSRLGHLMLLTDGETEERDDIMPRLLKVKEENAGRLPCTTLSAFGFGYEIDYKLLTELAEACGGTYAFIPDAGFVGTVFVNAMANLLATAASDVRLVVHGPVGRVMGLWKAVTDSDEENGLVLDLGILQYGQSKDIVVLTASDTSKISATIKYTLTGAKEQREVVTSAKRSTSSLELEIERHLCRCRFLETLQECVDLAPSLKPGARPGMQQETPGDLAGALEKLKAFGLSLAASKAAETEEVKALGEDVMGQCCEALSKEEYWRKWGRLYLPSNMSAHKNQLCNNFKDPGVQVYGGKLFLDERDKADEEFNQLPAPKITPAMYRYMGGGGITRNTDYRPSVEGVRQANPGPAISMAAFNDRYAGCIGGTSLVWCLLSQQPKPIAELAKGDFVAAFREDLDSEPYIAAEVLCVLRTACPGGFAHLVELPGGVRLTPYHPVFIEGSWRFPTELAPAEEQACEAVYTVLLGPAETRDSPPPALLVGTECLPCAAIGHGLQEGAAAHPFFSDREVILRDLANFPGFAEGLGVVELGPDSTVRDPDTGLVCGLRPALSSS